MSLDVYLQGKLIIEKCTCTECWNEHKKKYHEEFYSANITHNLGNMADKSGIYYALWRPEERGWKKAKDIIPVLEKGLAKLIAKPKYFEKFNAPNGWGLYEHFVPFVENYLQACKEHPNAKIVVSR